MRLSITSASIAIGILVIAAAMLGAVSASIESVTQTNDVSIQLQKLWNFSDGNDVYKVGWIPDANDNNFSDIIICTGGKPSLYCLDGLNGNIIWNYNGTANVMYFKVVPSENNNHQYIVGASFKEIFLLDANNGSRIWNLTCTIDLMANPALAVPDTTGDGVAEVLFAEVIDSDQNLVLLNGINGETLWKSGYNWSLVGICEISEFDEGSIIVYAIKDRSTYPMPCYIVALNSTNGVEVWRHSLSIEYWIRNIICAPMVSSNSSDVVVNLGYQCLLLRGDNGEEVWRRSVTLNPPQEAYTDIFDIAVVSDLNGDGVNDVIEGGWDYYTRALSGTTGSTIWQTSSGQYPPEVITTINDLDQDGLPEILVGTGRGRGIIHILSGIDGHKLASYPLSSQVQSDVWDVNPVPDLNGDGFEDIIVGSWDNNAYLLTPVVARDQIPPQISFTSPQNGSTINSTGAAEITINASYHDNIAVNIASLKIKMDGEVVSDGVELKPSYVACSLTIDPGSHIVELSVDDYSGNTANSIILFNVILSNEKIFYSLQPTALNILTESHARHYQSADAISLLQQADDAYNIAIQLSAQGNWSGAVDHINRCTTLANQAYQSESAFQAQQQQNLLTYQIIVIIVFLIVVLVLALYVRNRKKGEGDYNLTPNPFPNVCVEFNGVSWKN